MSILIIGGTAIAGDTLSRFAGCPQRSEGFAMKVHSVHSYPSQRFSSATDRDRSRFIARVFTQVAAAFRAAAVTLVSTLASVGTASGQCYYTYQEIPNPPGWFCNVGSINERGHVAGMLFNSGDATRGFFWSPETGTQALPMPPGVWGIEVHDLNDSDVVVGSMIRTTENGGAVAFLWDGAEYTIIDRPAWANGIEAVGINNAGQVVGTVSNNITGLAHLFTWEDGIFTDLGGFGTGMFVQAINELGESCGHSADMETRGFVVRDGEVEWLPTPPGHSAAFANDLTENGFAAGRSRVDEPFHFDGIVWSATNFTLVSPPPASRYAVLRRINRFGRAVGFYDDLDSGLAWQNGVAYRLRTMTTPQYPTRISYGWDINDSGTILAQAEFTMLVLAPLWQPGDLTGDCHVGLEDLLLVLRDFGCPVGSYPMGDVDVDGDTDISDLTLMLGHWGK